jgi:hypothetical protein
MAKRKAPELSPSCMAEPLYTIESASPEEIAMCDERMKEYERDPSSFVPRRKRVTG